MAENWNPSWLLSLKHNILLNRVGCPLLRQWACPSILFRNQGKKDTVGPKNRRVAPKNGKQMSRGINGWKNKRKRFLEQCVLLKGEPLGQRPQVVGPAGEWWDWGVELSACNSGGGSSPPHPVLPFPSCHPLTCGSLWLKKEQGGETYARTHARPHARTPARTHGGLPNHLPPSPTLAWVRCAQSTVAFLLCLRTSCREAHW